ncbi:MAG: hypothetical protein JWM16_4843 [Verrucomicrobiales bacterium]|nr:hypothetical protein [Verrucomicrobiales bacterium]
MHEHSQNSSSLAILFVNLVPGKGNVKVPDNQNIVRNEKPLNPAA